MLPEHRLDVARVGEGVLADLVQERRHADVLGPLLRDPLLEPDAGAQPQEGVEVGEAVAQAQHGQAAFDDDRGGERGGQQPVIPGHRGGPGRRARLRRQGSRAAGR
jgi:hypothetical protein